MPNLLLQILGSIPYHQYKSCPHLSSVSLSRPEPISRRLQMYKYNQILILSSYLARVTE